MKVSAKNIARKAKLSDTEPLLKMHQHKPQNTQQHAKGAAKATPKVDAQETVSLKVGEKDDVFKRQSGQVLQRLTKPEIQKKPVETIQKAEATVQRKESHERQVRMGLRPAVQTKLTVNQPGDRHEQEADSMASKVMRMSDAEVKRSAEPEVKRKQAAAPAFGEIQKKESAGIQRRGEGVPQINAETQAAIQSPSGGQKMPPSVQRFMEKRFKVDFSQVQIHNDAQSAVLNNRLGAKAFTFKNHIHFSRGAYQPETSAGKELLAHELTHVVQQGYAVKRKPEPAISRAPAKVQRLGVSDALDYFADKAYNIPGYRMFCILLGVNPINMRAEERNAANILRAVVEFLPGGNIITRVLDQYGVFEKAGAWVEGQLSTLGISGASIRAAINQFLDSLGWRDIFDLGGVWDRAKKIFTDPITRIITFVKNLFSAILEMIRQAVLMPLAKLAQGTRGYDLLKAVLGKDPITGEVVPQTADNLIGGFMKLIGQEEIYENLKKGNAVAKALAWFKTVLKGVVAFVTGLPALIIKTLTSLTINDFLSLSALYDKVVKPFVNFVGDFISWGLAQILELLKILFSVVAPGVMPYITKAQAAFSTILKNPVRFIGNLVKAGKLGFQNFASNILTHLKTALIKWLVGPLAEAGVHIPKSFDLLEIVKLVLSVLGLTWQNIRAKLVKIIPEPVLVALEKTASVLVTLVKDGPAAAWEQIKGELSELKDQLIAKITEMVSLEVVKAAVIKLASMLNPVGAVIQAIISIYNTIMFFVEKINQIAATVASFIDSIAAIASGQVDAAAKKVESTMANTLTIIIAFLAKFAGVGGIPAKLVGIVKKIRQPIDKGLDKIVGWLGGMLKKLASSVAQAGLPSDPNERFKQGLELAEKSVNKFAGKKVGKAVLIPLLAAIKLRYGFQELNVYASEGVWWIDAVLNPKSKKKTNVEIEGGSTGKQKTMPLMTVNFEVKKEIQKEYDKNNVSLWTHYVDQLLLQETKLKSMKIKTWMANINNFYGNTSLKIIKQGRSKEGDARAAQIRYRLINDKAKELMSSTPTLNKDQAIALAKDYWSDQAVLHLLDQGGGGEGTELVGDLFNGGVSLEAYLGNARVDYSIGASWPTRAKELRTKIEENVDSSVLGDIEMNIVLKPVKK